MSHKRASHRLRLSSGVAVVAALMSVTACSSTSDSTFDSTSDSPSEAASEPSSSATAGATPSSPPQALGEQHVVTRDGHDLVFYLTAGTEGTIVLDAGGGNDATYWNDIVPELAAATGAAIVTYDRTGAGLSDDVAGPWDPSAAGEDLATGLESLDLPDGPLVLAGHSIAGEVAHAFVNAHPETVDGAVLIDANLPPFFTPEQVARLAEANAEGVAALEAEPATRESRQLLSVAESWVPVHTAFHAVTWPQDIPVGVIVAEDTPMPPSSEDAQNWRDAARAFVDQADNRHLVTAQGSSHDVTVDDPELVKQEIEDMFGEVSS